MNGRDPSEDDLMSLVHAAVPQTGRSDAAAQPDAPADDASFASTRAELQMAIETEGSGPIDVSDPGLDSLLADLDKDDSPPSSGKSTEGGSGMIVIADILGEAATA